MGKVFWTVMCFFSTVLFLAASASAQATVSGQVRTVTGVPIKGATVKLVTLNLTRTTDDSGKYDFNVPLGVLSGSEQSKNVPYSIAANGRQIIVTMIRSEKVSIELFDLSGRRLRMIAQGSLQQGSHHFVMDASDMNSKSCVIKIQAGTTASYHKAAFLNNAIIGFSDNRSSSMNDKLLLKSSSIAAADSIAVTHPDYWGGLDGINARKISATTGVQNFRMFSNDTSAAGWFASKMNFVFTPDTVGVSYYKQKVTDYEYEERQTQREIQQCFYRLPTEVPANKKYATYNVNINATVTTGVAATGGNTLSLNPGYCNNKSWWEILGVQHHEMCHSYQQYYNTTGAAGFGEAIVDAVRCLSGFFYWPAGSKCSGGFDQPYQTGGRYWYYMELKHPGFIYAIMSSPNTGDISARVLSITGDSLATMCRECEASGMPYTLGRGSY
jgi:hypothetical protein